MPNYITTYTGLHINPSKPDADCLRLEDIAHALSLICRGNGHVKSFFSVGEHCILCAKEAAARNYPRRLILACLLHDAGEAYLSDVPRPIKKGLSGYIATEQALLDVIYTKYLGSPLSNEEEFSLQTIDNDLLYYDLRDLLNDVIPGPEPEIHVAISRKVRRFEDVELEYLEMAKKLLR